MPNILKLLFDTVSDDLKANPSSKLLLKKGLFFFELIFLTQTCCNDFSTFTILVFLRAKFNTLFKAAE